MNITFECTKSYIFFEKVYSHTFLVINHTFIYKWYGAILFYVLNHTLIFKRYTVILFYLLNHTFLCTQSYIPWFSKGIPWYYLSHVFNHTLIFNRHAVTNVSKSYISVGQRYFFTLWSTVGIVPHTKEGWTWSSRCGWNYGMACVSTGRLNYNQHYNLYYWHRNVIFRPKCYNM